jgi:amidase
MDTIAMAEAVRRRELSPAELLDAAIARIEARNPALNAVVERLFERARTRADRLPDGPLRGVPFLVKDLVLQLEGTVTTQSTRLGVGRVAARSSQLAERYEAAGVQILGKTNTPEFGIMGVTEPELRGPARNPWGFEHTPGGSSGGSAAAVAARMVPAAHGGDGGGSIRIPASACGLVGLKPSRGRVSMAPFASEAWGGLVQEHVLTRSVRDSALFLDAVDAPTAGEPFAAPPKARPWTEEAARDPKRLKIAFTREALFADASHPDCSAAVDDAVALLRSLGHEVDEARPDFSREALTRAYFLMVATGVAADVEEAARAAGKAPSFADFEPGTWVLAMIGWKATAMELTRARAEMLAASRALGDFHGRYDLFLTSTLARPPAKIGELMPSGSERAQIQALRFLGLKPLLDHALETMAKDKLAATPNTQLFNLTGQPAISLPLHWNAAGLPVGVQLAAPLGGEGLLFQIARQLEVARPWAHRMPPTLSEPSTEAVARDGSVRVSRP